MACTLLDETKTVSFFLSYSHDIFNLSAPIIQIRFSSEKFAFCMMARDTCEIPGSIFILCAHFLNVALGQAACSTMGFEISFICFPCDLFCQFCNFLNWFSKNIAVIGYFKVRFSFFNLSIWNLHLSILSCGFRTLFFL